MLKNGKDITFGIGDPQSTSGTLVPRYYVFAHEQHRPEDALQGRCASRNHEANLLAVLNKQVDVATNNTEMTREGQGEVSRRSASRSASSGSRR